MSLETIVSKMIAANEPESNIAKVIKHYKKIPLKAVAACPDGYELDEFDNCKEISQNTETWQDQEGNYISKEEYNNIEEDGGSGTDFKEELWKNVNKAQQEEKLPQSGIVDLKNYNEGLTPKILDDNLTPNPSNDCGEGYTYIDGRGCVEDVSLDEVVLTQQEQLDDEGNLINKPLPEGMFVEEEEGSSDDLLDDSKKWDDFNREEVLKINLIPALDRNEFIKNFDQKTLNARKSEREAFSKQSAAPIQARYNQNKIQVEVDNKEQISNFLDKLYRDSDMGVYENGQWIVDPNKVDVNSEEFKNKSQENFKIYNDYLNKLVGEYNLQDVELLNMIDSYKEDQRVNDLMIVNKAKQNNEIYQNAYTQIVKNTQADVDAFVDKKLTEEVGEEGSIKRAFNKFWNYTIPSLRNTSKLQGERYKREKILGLKEEIEQVPDGSTVSYPPPREVNSPGLGGMRTMPAGKTTKENALKLINRSLNSSGEKEFERLLTDAKIQKILSLFDQTEFFDEDGATGQDIKDIVVEQALNVGASVATAGLFTGATESASVMRGILSKKAAKNLNISEEKFNSLPAKQQAEAMADVKDWELNTALAVGIGAMVLDNASLIVGGKAILGKIPTQVYRKLIRKGALTSAAGRQLTKETLKGLTQPVLVSTGVEILTESGQDVFQRVGIETGTGGGASAAVNAVFSDPKAWKELIAQTALSTILLTGGGKIAFSGGKFAWKNAAAYLTSNNFNESKQGSIDTIQEEYNEKEKFLDQLLKDGDINRSEYNRAVEKIQLELDENFLEIEVTDNILNNLNLKFLSAESKLKIFPLAKSIFKNDKRLEELQDVLKKLGPKKKGRPTNERKALEAEIAALKEENSNLNKQVFQIKAKDLGKNKGGILDNLINTDNTGVFKGKFILRRKTVEEAEEVIKDLGYDVSKEKKDPNSEIGNLLKGDNNAIVLDDNREGKEGEKVAIVVEDNKARNLANNDYISQNADQHEGLHFILDMFSEEELTNLRANTISDIITSEDSDLKQVLKGALDREQGYIDDDAKRKKETEEAGEKFVRNENLVQEFFTALSDSMFELEVVDLSLPETTLVSKIAATISKALGVKTGNTLDLNNFTNPKNALEFIKSFNNFNKDGKIINKKTDLQKAKEIAKKRGVVASKPLNKEELAVELDKVNKGEISDELAFQAAYAYEPLARATANKMFRNYSEFGESAINEELFGDELWIGEGANSLLGLAKSYDPEIGSIGGYFKQFLPERAKAVMQRLIGKSATTGATSIDTKESRQLTDNQEVNIEANNAIDAIGLPKPLLDFVKNSKLGELGAIATEMAVKKLPKNATNKQKISVRNKAFNNFIKNQIAIPFKKELLKTTKNKDTFQKYINKNWKAIGDVYLNNTEISKIRNENTRDTLEDWQDNGFTKEDVFNYFNDPSIANSARSDRKNVGLVNALVSAVSDQIRMDFATKNPEISKTFKEKTGIPLAQKSIPSYFLNNPSNPANGTLRYKNLKELLEDNGQVYITKDQLKTVGDVKNLKPKLKPVLQFIGLGIWGEGKTNFLKPSLRILSSALDGGKKYTKEVDGKIVFSDKKGKGIWVVNKNEEAVEARQDVITAFDKMIKELVSEAKDAGPLMSSLEGKKVSGQVQLYGLAEDYVNRPPNSAGKTPEQFEANIERTKARNPVNAAMGKQVWSGLYQAMVHDPKTASIIGWILQNSSMGASSWHRVWAQVEGWSPNPVGKMVTKKDGTKELVFYTYEHAMPAKEAYLALMDAALNKVPFEVAFNAVEANYKIIALDINEDGKLIRATDPRTGIEYNFKDAMGDPDWNFYTGNHKQRYFNQIIPALFGGVGISPSGISDLNGRNYADKYNINDKGESTLNTQALASKPLSKEFNKMLERTKGITAEAVYSDARAAKMGGKKGFQAFVPYSAEDFLGLVYPTLGKGEQGNKDLKWWKDNVMNPYNDGMSEFEISKQASMLEWKQIKKQLKNTPTNLRKEAVRDFSNEDAIRVYLWDQRDLVPSDLSKKDVKALVNHVKKNQYLTNFANQVNSLNANGYPAPTKGWLAGTITTDLVNHVNTTTRSEMLKPWQEAIDEIYTDDNKNKLRATYGDKYIEALDDVLYRMKSGRNRPSGANRITNNWLNWVNDSVGTIMFFNQRSAVLQTISSINFINWSDNNPAAAAKAFANQKQYWTDFSYLFNSDFLKQRRSGLKTDVNADEIAQQATNSTNKVRASLSWLLKKGFLPTQIADSFAIASGGSTFYRNRVNSLVKSGMSKVDAEKQAFSDFRNSANESQQSSDPSRISMEQASSLGRVILAFANTPIQYTRLTKRAVQDLVAGRGDAKTNISKILYYGAVQNIIFTTLQQAMFGMLFADDDDEFQNERKDQATFNLVNSAADTFLRGSGVSGAFVAMLKNMALEIKRQSDKKRSDYTRVADKLFTVSPPIDSKFKKLKAAGRTFTYKQELKKIREKGIAIDNPALMAAAQVISAFGNIPIDRVLRKLNNIVESTNSENAIWQRIALSMGWGQWELGITDRKTDEARTKAKKEKEETKKFKNLQKYIDKENKKTPIKALEAGVLGEANKDGSIVVANGLSKEKRKEVIKHEKAHQKEISSGKLDYDDNFVYYGKKKYERNNGKIIHNGKAKIEGDPSLPWEKVAHKVVHEH